MSTAYKGQGSTKIPTNDSMFRRSILILFCHHLVMDSMIFSREVADNPSVNVKLCKDASECPFSYICAVCQKGFEPGCQRPTCIDGQCGVIKLCSQSVLNIDAPSAVRPPNQCTDADTSQCIVDQICAGCRAGYSPACAEVRCEYGQCKTISPCSTYTPTLMTTKSSTRWIVPTASTKSGCQTDGECAYVKQCVSECKEGLGPLCTFSNCINGQCRITAPCSQKLQCTDKDTSQCIVSPICAGCHPGYSPGCSEASCENGQCKVISPCSIFDGSSKTTTTPRTMITSTTATQPNTCTNNKQCIRSRVCVPQCSPRTKPTCASARCVDGRCIQIPPCSQRICKTKATCPFNANNCRRCPVGFKPRCEQAACNRGVCSIILPCSGKLRLMTGLQLVINMNLLKN